jgi:DNA/RNA-binding domain of Phe-tRNA-synthetase-like protein
MAEELELSPAAGFIAPELRAEFPGLRLNWVTVEAHQADSPAELKRRLRDLSNRYRGASVVAMRGQPIPLAYRAFFRQIGLDPDVQRPPAEEAAVGRLLDGHFRSRELVHDALLIALIETGVPVWALDADLLDAGGPGIRATAAGERLGSTEYGSHLPAGRLVVADARWVHALLFGDLAPGHEVNSRTRRIALFTVGVEGVPAIHLDEALWVCVEAIHAGRRRRR